MTRNRALRVGFERNYESEIPGCGMYLRERVVSGFPELMVRDSGPEGDAGMCKFWEWEVFSTIKGQILNNAFIEEIQLHENLYRLVKMKNFLLDKILRI
jgi:hypothetical protein